ncbi:MAG: hypothetical protein HYU36_06420 [Planctomycetes bacterium]|nr:hypothetical protein [Planctomycetota bacterium]
MLVGLLAWVIPASSAGLEWSVAPGLGGLRERGKWCYLVVQVESSEEACQAEIVVRNSTRLVYRHPIEVPRGSEQRHFVYFMPESPECEVSLEVGGQPAGPPRVATLQRARWWGFVGLVEVGTPTRVDLALEGDSASPIAGLAERVYVRSDWKDLPADPAGYDAVQVMFLSNVDRSVDVSFGQAAALRAWVETGGCLMVFLGREGFVAEGPIRDLLDAAHLTVSGSMTFGGFTALRGGFSPVESGETLRIARIRAPEGSALWQNEGVTLSAVAPLGWGRIGICALHPGQLGGTPEETGWSWKPIFRLVGLHRAEATRPGEPEHSRPASRSSLPDHFGSLLIPGEVALPLSMGWIIIYLAAYLAVLGPFQAWLIRHGKSFAFCAAVFLASVFFFVALAGVIVSWKKGDEVWLREVGLVSLSEKGAARGILYTSFFVPRSGRVQLRFGPEVLVGPMDSLDWGLGWTRGIFGEQPREWIGRYLPEETLAEIRVQQWNGHVLASRFWHVPPRLAGVSPLPEGLLPKLRRTHWITSNGICELGEADLETISPAPAGKKVLPAETFLKGLRPYRSGEDHSEREIEDVLLGLCLGEPRHVPDVDVLDVVASGRSVLVGFTECPRLHGELSITPSHVLRVCLVRRIVETRSVERGR